MIVISGPSASGKTEIANMLIRKYNLKRVVTCTTRPKRVGEIDDVHYHFFTKEEFLKRIEKDEFLEYTMYNDNYYGTLKKEVSREKIVVLDPNGVNAINEKIPNLIKVFFLEAPVQERIRRMHGRGDSQEKIDARLIYDVEAFRIDRIHRIDHIIPNHNVTIEQSADLVYELYQPQK